MNSGPYGHWGRGGLVKVSEWDRMYVRMYVYVCTQTHTHAVYTSHYVISYKSSLYSIILHSTLI